MSVPSILVVLVFVGIASAQGLLVDAPWNGADDVIVKTWTIPADMPDVCVPGVAQAMQQEFARARVAFRAEHMCANIAWYIVDPLGCAWQRVGQWWAPERLASGRALDDCFAACVRSGTEVRNAASHDVIRYAEDYSQCCGCVPLFASYVHAS